MSFELHQQKAFDVTRAIFRQLREEKFSDADIFGTAMLLAAYASAKDGITLDEVFRAFEAGCELARRHPEDQ